MDYSFFLFGARGTGKSTLLTTIFEPHNTPAINLLNPAEEIWSGRLVNDLEHFRRFLEVAAQSNGKIVNYSNIARYVGVDDKTVKNYFTLLEDTLIGNFLEPFDHSFRKRL